ncbi:MAG: hypothetical protein H6942_12875 [Candidatus Accumulibacter sp.]|nr:hypothetical protein [Accumulibacter sp.]
MGLLPIRQFAGAAGVQYRNPSDPELRLDFVTCAHRNGEARVAFAELGLAPQPLEFMEFSLQGSIHGCLVAREGACTVNLPDPARYAVHKLIVYGECPLRERTRASKDLHQAACLASFFAARGRWRASTRRRVMPSRVATVGRKGPCKARLRSCRLPPIWMRQNCGSRIDGSAGH